MEDRAPVGERAPREGEDVSEWWTEHLDPEIVAPAREMRATARPTGKDRRGGRSKTRPEGWVPFRDAPEKVRRRFQKQLDRAHREPTVAIKLFCIECMGYSESEPRSCAALTCPLYALNRRIFVGRARRDLP